jgi:hypothetical protein
LAFAAKNRSGDTPVPKNFEIHRTGSARARTGVFRAPSPQGPPPSGVPQRSIDTGLGAESGIHTSRHRRSGCGTLRCRIAPSQSDPASAAPAPTRLGPNGVGMCPRNHTGPAEWSRREERVVAGLISLFVFGPL